MKKLCVDDVWPDHVFGQDLVANAIREAGFEVCLYDGAVEMIPQDRFGYFWRWSMVHVVVDGGDGDVWASVGDRVVLPEGISVKVL